MKLWIILKEIGHALNYISDSMTFGLRGILTLTCLLVISETYTRIRPMMFLYVALVLLNMFSMMFSRMSYSRYKTFCRRQEAIFDAEEKDIRS